MQLICCKVRFPDKRPGETLPINICFPKLSEVTIKLIIAKDHTYSFHICSLLGVSVIMYLQVIPNITRFLPDIFLSHSPFVSPYNSSASVVAVIVSCFSISPRLVISDLKPCPLLCLLFRLLLPSGCGSRAMPPSVSVRHAEDIASPSRAERSGYYPG